MPSGILNPASTCVIGNGVVVHVPSLLEELKQLEDAGVDWKGRLLISDRYFDSPAVCVICLSSHLPCRAHLVFDFHQLADGFSEAKLGRFGGARLLPTGTHESFRRTFTETKLAPPRKELVQHISLKL